MIKVEIEQDAQVPEIQWLKASYNNGVAWSLIEIRSYEDALQIISALQQSVQADGAILSPIERDWSGEVEDKAWAHLQNRPAANASR